jgi:hypothetical protein
MKINTMELHTLDNLFQLRERELRALIGNLQLEMVRDDKRFEATIGNIKEQILLTPATIGEASIHGNRQEARQVRPNYQMMWGGQQDINIVTVNFSVSGSDELFEYRASGSQLTVTSVYTPDYGSISIDIEVPVLDKAQALAKANEEIKTTRTLIEQNNPVVQAWSQRMSQQIESMATQKRKELMDFYS